MKNRTVARYVDAMKQHYQCIVGITDDNILVRFIQGLKPTEQWDLKDNFMSFSDACMDAEIIGCWYVYLSEMHKKNYHKVVLLYTTKQDLHQKT